MHSYLHNFFYSCKKWVLHSGTDPASGYNLVLSHLFIMFFLFLYRLSINTNNPYTAIILLIFTHSMICFMIFKIKICHKMTNSNNLVTAKLVRD
jgi:hypothetical protein